MVLIAFHYTRTVTGAQVKRVRQAMGLTQYEFANRLGVHPVTVAKWETDAQGIRGPAVRLMALLAEGATTANPKSASAPRAKVRNAPARQSGKRKKG
jgi:transcriptional regulator with XRE-family HTH domain